MLHLVENSSRCFLDSDTLQDIKYVYVPWEGQYWFVMLWMGTDDVWGKNRSCKESTNMEVNRSYEIILLYIMETRSIERLEREVEKQ